MEQQAPELKAEEKTPEQLEREMLQTRESITEKVVALENKVVGTAQSVTNAVSDTVEAVKSLVSNAPSAVSDTIKQSVATVREQLDITGCIRRNPGTSVGVSAAVGFFVGFLLGGRRDRELASTMQAAAHMPAHSPKSVDRGPSEPGVFDELVGMLGTEAKKLVREAIDTTSSALKQNIHSGVPKLIDTAANRIQPEPAI